MKKSTLITTIAMIVVVVVALSTATYAWFTSAQTTTVQMNVQTQSTTGWGMLANTAAIGTSNAKYQATASATSMVFSGTAGISALNEALWCPIGEVTATVSSDTNVCTYTPGTRFFQALQEDTENFTAIACTEAPKFYQSEVVRITNGASQDLEGQLTITISFPNTDQTESTVLSSALAAAGLRFVIVGTEGVVASTDYKYVTAASARGSATAIEVPASMVNTANENTYTLIYGTHTGSNLDSAQTLDAANIEAGKTTTSGGFAYCSTADSSYGLSVGDYYVQYTFDVPEVKAGKGINYAIYYWLDGGVLSTAAGAAGIELFFTMGDAPAVAP